MGKYEANYEALDAWQLGNLFKYSSVPTSIWITLMLILSLYMWPNHRQR